MVDDTNLRRIQRQISRMSMNENDAWQYVLALIETDWVEVARVDHDMRKVSCSGCSKKTLLKLAVSKYDALLYCPSCVEIIEKGYHYTCPDCRKKLISHSYRNYRAVNTVAGKRFSFRCSECEEKYLSSFPPVIHPEHQCIGCGSMYDSQLYTRPSLCPTCRTAYDIDEKTIRKEYQKVSSHLIRAHELGLPATLTLDEWFSRLISAQWICQYCLTFPYENADHFIPLCKGGGTTKDNMVPSCTQCNRAKAQQHPDTITSLSPDVIERVRVYLQQP